MKHEFQKRDDIWPVKEAKVPGIEEKTMRHVRAKKWPTEPIMEAHLGPQMSGK